MNDLEQIKELLRECVDKIAQLPEKIAELGDQITEVRIDIASLRKPAEETERGEI